MIKFSILSILLISLGLATYAQTGQTRYYMPNGKEVARDKLDSVAKAWGGSFTITHDKNHPEDVHLSPEIIKATEAQDAALKQMQNHPAPNFTLTDISGKQWKLSALKGKIVVLNFWFAACSGCVDEMPQLNELKKSYAASDIVFLGLSTDESQTIKKFLRNHAFNYKLFPKAGVVSKAYHVKWYPTSIIIDRQGVLRFQYTGSNDTAEKLKAAINTIDRT